MPIWTTLLFSIKLIPCQKKDSELIQKMKTWASCELAFNMCWSATTGHVGLLIAANITCILKLFTPVLLCFSLSTAYWSTSANEMLYLVEDVSIKNFFVSLLQVLIISSRYRKPVYAILNAVSKFKLWVVFVG